MRVAAEEVAPVGAAVEEGEVEAEEEAEAEEAEEAEEVEEEAEVEEVQVVAVTTPHLLLEGGEEEGEETVLSTKLRCSNNWKRFCSNNNKRPQVAALRVSRPPTRSRPPIKTDNVLP